MSREAIVYLRSQEWGMGNGQCGCCGGHRPGYWAPHPCVPTKAHEGHYDSCELEAALRSLDVATQHVSAGRTARVVYGDSR